MSTTREIRLLNKVHAFGPVGTSGEACGRAHTARLARGLVTPVGGLLLGSAVFLLLLSPLSCKRATLASPTADVSGPADQGTSQDDLAKEREERKARFTPKTVEQRDFVILLDGQRVGRVRMTVEEWHKGVTLVTEFAKKMFPAAGFGQDYYYWSRIRHSESPTPNKWWGNGQIGPQGFDFEVSGSGAGFRYTTRWFRSVVHEAKGECPTNYILFQEFAKTMKEATGEAGSVVVLPVLYWRSGPGAYWRARHYLFEDREEVRTVDGATVSAWRFRCSEETDTGSSFQVWVDENGYPVRKFIPQLRLDIVMSKAVLPEDTAGLMDWPTAEKKWSLAGEGDVYERIFKAFNPGAAYPESLFLDFDL